MTTDSPEIRRRIPAAERRTLVIEAAADVFAAFGYEAATTAAIAERAGVSQPYVVRLFGTKKALFMAVAAGCFARVDAAFRAAAAAVPPEQRFGAMGEAYLRLLEDRRDLRLQLHAYAACDDPEIAAAVRDGYADLVATCAEITGGDGADLLRFFSHGMLLNVMAATGLAEIADHRPELAAMLAVATKRPAPGA